MPYRSEAILAPGRKTKSAANTNWLWISILGLAIIGICLGVVHFQRRAKLSAAIEAAMERDSYYFHPIQIGQDVWNPQRPKDILELVNLGTAYASNCASMDLSGCPKPFRTIYLRHLDNWRKVTSELKGIIEEQAKNSRPLEWMESRVKEASQRLDVSWQAITTSALSYNVKVRQ